MNNKLFVTGLGYGLLVLLMLPYVKLFPNDFDAQPHVLIAAFIGAIFFYRGLKFEHILLFIPVLGALVVSVFYSEASNLIIRSIVTYSSPFFVTLFVYGLCCCTKNILRKSTELLVFLNFLICLIQVFWGVDAISSIVNVRTSMDRGVTGFAVEPSFLGFQSIFLFLILVVTKGNWVARLLCVVELVIFSQSVLAIISAGLLFVVYMIQQRKVMYVILCFVVVALSIQLTGFVSFGDSRLFNMFSLIFLDSGNILNADGSTSERFSHLYLSFFSGFENLFLPRGFSQFSGVLASETRFWVGEPTDKIMSGLGAPVFELGWFAFPFFFLLWHLRNTGRYGWICVSAVGLIYLNALPLSNPFYGIIIGYLIFIKNNERC